MAGPTILVTIAANLKGFSDSVSGAASAAQSGIGKIHDAFGSMLSTLNQTGVLGPFGAALNGVDQAIGAIVEHGKGIGTVTMAVGGAVAGIGAGLQALGSHEQAAQQQLQASIEATGKSWDDYSDQIDAAVKKQENFGNSAADTERALQILTQATGDPQKALTLLGTASDLAAAKHESLDSAASQLGRTYNGATKMLKEFGIDAAPKAASATKSLEAATNAAEAAASASQKAHQHLADVQATLAGKTTLTAAEQIKLRDAQAGVVDADGKAQDAHNKLILAQQNATKAASGQMDTMDALSNKLKGQDSAAADTFGGKVAALKAKIEDATAAFGQKYGPAITIAGTAMAGLGGVMQVLTGIQAALAATTFAALAPYLLIGAAILALVAIGYVLYRNWDTIWSFIKNTVETVWNWIKTNWPLLLPILLGPFGIVLALIIKNFGTIKQVIKDVIDWLVGAWDAIYQAVEPVVAAIVGVFQFMAGVLYAIAQVLAIPFEIAWQLIYFAVQQVINGIVAAWNWLMEVLQGIANALAGPFNAAWNAILSVVGTVVNAIVGAWNGFVGFISGIVRTIASVLSGPWHAASDAVGTVVGAIKSTWDGLISWFQGAISRMSGIFGGMWNGISAAFRAAINAVIDLWNSLHIPGIDFGPVHVAGISVPHINRLATGGIVNQPTLALIGEAGPEAVVPLNRLDRRLSPGNQISFGDVHLHDGADVDLMLQKIRFAITAGRL